LVVALSAAPLSAADAPLMVSLHFRNVGHEARTVSLEAQSPSGCCHAPQGTTRSVSVDGPPRETVCFASEGAVTVNQGASVLRCADNAG